MSAGLSAPPQPGTLTQLRFTKYDGGRHWEYDVVVLGVDDHGVWVGGWPQDVCRRPGREITPGVHWVTLVPHEGDWIATFNQPGGVLGAGVYVDMTDTPRWSHVEVEGRPGLHLTCSDLDLDVVRRFGGECYIDDEDEFAEHQVRYGYPPEVIAGARATADELFLAVSTGAEPFTTVGLAWLERCIATTREDTLALVRAAAEGATN